MRQHRRAFTLVELLVVIGIIALLLSILMPTLSKAREAANRVKCGSNFRQIGLSITMFANANKARRIPYAECTSGYTTGNSGGFGVYKIYPTGFFKPDGTMSGLVSDWRPENNGAVGAGPWWPQRMYAHDFFRLCDQFGARTALFVCPSVEIENREFSEVGFRVSGLSGSSPYTASPSIDAGDPSDPNNFFVKTSNHGEEYARYVDKNNDFPDEVDVQGDPSTDPATVKWFGAGQRNGKGTWFNVMFGYVYFGGTPLCKKTPVGGRPGEMILSPIQVYKLNQKTYMGGDIDSNPPIMADIAWMSSATYYRMNHGKKWFALPGQVSKIGDVKFNVLYRDGHVELRSPTVPFMNYGGADWYR